MKISEKIRVELKKAIDGGATYYAVGRELGIAQQVLSRFATGERPLIRADTIDKLCEYLGLELIESQPGKSPATPTVSPAAAKSPATKPAAKAAIKAHSKPAKKANGKRGGRSAKK